MRMKFVICVVTLACLIDTAEALSCKMPYIQRLTPAQQAMRSDLIVIGTVMSIESDLVQAAPLPGGSKANYIVALVKINNGLHGVKGVTHIRVGFIPNQNPGYYANEEFFEQQFSGPRGSQVILSEGQAACFFLQKHHEADFFVYPQHGTPLVNGSLTYADDLETVKQMVKIRSNPIEALKAQKVDDRKLAATMLLMNHRTAPRVGANQQLKQEPVDAEESKLILEALAQFEPMEVLDQRTPQTGFQSAFYTLGLSDKDGWKQPTVQPGQDAGWVTGEAMKKWLTENSSKYRVQRYSIESTIKQK